MKREEITELAIARLNGCREAIVDAWNHPIGTETRHFYVDDFLPVEIAREAYAAFPKSADGFHSRETFREKKRTSAHLDAYEPILREITYALQDKRVVDLVAELVGFEAIEPDPLLYAGGLSMMFAGDFLNPHIDNSHDGKRDRYRRLNLLYYVSPDWCFENGGNFELWDDKRQVPKTIVSAENRLLVMETNKTSWHSVSPVTADYPRCCVSNYYFSHESPDKSQYFHVTSFTGRPEETLKRALAVVDNGVRNTISKTLGIGRGKGLIRKSESE
jgi:Rps23 Pro-64 3,4-dihydroxylase Tpa1-like proline 4-hydroxylase